MAKTTDGKRRQSASHGTQANPAEIRGVAPPGSRSVVHYNAELFELCVNGTLVKRLDMRATNQKLILTVFQEENWRQRIDDPLPPNGGDGKARLRDTTYSLNGGQRPQRIRFFADGSGNGVRWELVPQVMNASQLRKRRRR